ncbi:MAG TPA: peptidoglycan DD-metalloendopeptidase family protein [Actinomycetota bacterium]|nr:peptidoglycan DD-metalloendopeptidase family protein [Actinomycetota bacterium]
MTVRKRHLKIVLALALLPAGFLTTPGALAGPDTEDQLQAARRRLAQLESEASAATARYEELHAKLITTREDIAATREAMGRAERRLSGLAGQLAERARAAYQLGTSSTLELLLTAESLTELSDRLVYLDELSEQDASLASRVDVLAEELRRQRADLARLEAEYAKAEAAAERELDVLYAKLDEARALEEKYEDELAAERAAAAPVAAASGGSGSIPAVRGQALQACPAPGTSFSDTYGAPRSGGRSHQGVDMLGPYGTPVYAAQSGSVTHSSSSLGGIQAYVYGPNGDVTFYAHLQGYSDASGQVSAGTLIGYIGDTGNAAGTPHLHFEYHPGGVVTNPTPYVAAVC